MYVRKPRQRALMGLGGASDCGANQTWDPNMVVFGLPPGQCVNKDPAKAASDIAAANAAGGNVSSSTDWGGAFAAGLKTLFGGPAQPQMVMQPSSGISTTTLLIGGAAALAVIAIIATRK